VLASKRPGTIGILGLASVSVGEDFNLGNLLDLGCGKSTFQGVVHEGHASWALRLHENVNSDFIDAERGSNKAEKSKSLHDFIFNVPRFSSS
jgi:hypothetical protein